VANLMPGAVVRVELEYAHVVAKQHGDHRFHFPMVVGPRFQPPASTGGDAGAPTRALGEPEPLAVGVWNLPASSPVAPPSRIDRDRVSLRVELEAGMPIRSVESPSHPLDVEIQGSEARSVTLAGGRTLDNQDFELHYRLADGGIAAGVTTHTQKGDGFLSLLIEPPANAAADDITRREMVFVLDCSGSMSGVPLAASKRFMRKTLEHLRPGDSFRIIRFSDSATAWSESPLPATPDNVREGIRYVDALYGSGGTHMASGIRAALAPPVPEGALRLVVFLTDGYIGNDVEIVRLIEAQRGEARLFSFGIGTGVNRYLIQEMARVGRGAARIVRPDADAQRAADELVTRLDAPVLTDIEVDWGEAAVRDVFPREIPDLFMGETVRVMARYDAPGSHRVIVRGRVAGELVTLPVDLELPRNDEGRAGEALPIIWARSQVEDRMIEFISPGIDADEREVIQQEVTRLGLEHRLVTQWTSFVAVARAVVNPGGAGVWADVEVPRVAGLSDAAYPPGALPKGPGGPAGHGVLAEGVLPAQPAFAGAPMQLAASGGFVGASGPEPSTWLALSALAMMWGALEWRRRRRHRAHCGGGVLGHTRAWGFDGADPDRRR
jgi:Ca-activated chloride channel family protein